MSYTTITQCTRDEAFNDRVVAGAMKEAVASDEFSRDAFAPQLRNTPDMAIHQFIWPLSIDNEADYAVRRGDGQPESGW